MAIRADEEVIRADRTVCDAVHMQTAEGFDLVLSSVKITRKREDPLAHELSGVKSGVRGS